MLLAKIINVYGKGSVILVRTISKKNKYMRGYRNSFLFFRLLLTPLVTDSCLTATKGLRSCLL